MVTLNSADKATPAAKAPIPRMLPNPLLARIASGLLAVCLLHSVCAQFPDGPPPGGPDGPGQDGPPFGGFGGPGGPGGGPGFMQQEVKLVKQFDQDADKRLNAAERKAAREHLKEQPRRGGPGGRRGFGRGGEAAAAKPGPKVSPSDVKSFGDAPLYDPGVVRTFFLEFESQDWEKELADFHNTDVEVPAKLVVDGKSYADVGVHFRGASSYMMVPEGQKRSLNLAVDFAHEGQNLLGHRTLNLLNSHEDPSFLRTVLYYQIARAFVPAPRANFVRLVVNGESWGLYVSTEQYNKDFINQWFHTTKGARWKVPGSPNGRGSLAYLGDDPSAYKKTYDIKSKDDPKSWARLILLCQVLNETPADQLEKALAPLLDIDGALKFLALENVLINNDGYWVRSSDYNLYLDETGRFHVIPHDANETFATPGGPGFGGGPGGRGGFGPGMFLAPQLLSQADGNADQKLTPTEFVTLAETWFKKLASTDDGKVTLDQFTAKFDELLPAPQGFGPGRGGEGRPGAGGPGGARGGRGGFGPAAFIGPQLFAALDTDKDGSLTLGELKGTFTTWARDWDADKKGSLDEEALRNGLGKLMAGQGGGGRGGRGGDIGGPGGPGMGGPRGGGGPGGGMRVNGVELDPLVAASDAGKPLLSKLLAVPALRTRYLTFVRDIATQWLDWNKLGPIATQYHNLIAEQVAADTRKLDSTEDFEKAVTENIARQGGFGPGGREVIGLKPFAEKRRAYLLGHAEIQKLTKQ